MDSIWDQYIFWMASCKFLLPEHCVLDEVYAHLERIFWKTPKWANMEPKKHERYCSLPQDGAWYLWSYSHWHRLAFRWRLLFRRWVEHKWLRSLRYNHLLPYLSSVGFLQTHDKLGQHLHGCSLVDLLAILLLCDGHSLLLAMHRFAIF